VRWCLLLSLSVLLLGCDPRRPSNETAGSPATAQDGRLEYTRARAQFRTNLIHRRPSPEPPSAVHFNKLKRPTGVELVEFPSGDLRLKAWTQSPPAEGAKLPSVLSAATWPRAAVFNRPQQKPRNAKTPRVQTLGVGR